MRALYCLCRFLPIAALLLVPVSFAAAQSSLSVSITPPLFQLSIGPGESWSSSIKVVNTNAQDTTYYAYATDFQAQGETGNISFIPLAADATGTDVSTYSLASWIQLPSGPIDVPAGQSAQLPFTVTVPQDAEPGGHYAAILIGTEPLSNTASSTRVRISSYVSSLLLVTIKGNVTEDGRIREFDTSQQLYQAPQADFILRFENIGNTHIKPQGDITIYNMWGKVRGTVDIGQDSSDFGNVLPGSTRLFTFSWVGDGDIFDIGLYRAVVTLAYGDETKHNVSATTYFWIVPVVPVGSAAAGLLIFVLLVTWLIRRYVRRALALERERLRGTDDVPALPQKVDYSVGVLMEPLKESVIDLRSLAGGGSDTAAAPASANDVRGAMSSRRRMTVWAFVAKYRLAAFFLIVVIAGGIFAYRYFNGVLASNRQFQITDVQIREEAPATTTNELP